MKKSIVKKNDTLTSLNKTSQTRVSNKSKNIDYSASSLKKTTQRDQITEESDINQEDLEKTRQRLLLDSIIHRYAIAKDDKVYGLEGKNNERMLYNRLILTKAKFNNNTLQSLKEENDNYELIEKAFFENLLKENDDLSKQIKNLTDQISDIKALLHKVQGECNLYKYLRDSQDKVKNENVKKAKELDSEIKFAEEINKKLKIKYTNDTLENDNLYKAILNVTEKHMKKYNDNGKLVQEYKRLYNVYNNEYFLASYKSTDEDTIETLLGRIHFLKKQIEYKEIEYNNLNKIVFIDKKPKK